MVVPTEAVGQQKTALNQCPPPVLISRVVEQEGGRTEVRGGGLLGAPAL